MSPNDSSDGGAVTPAKTRGAEGSRLRSGIESTETEQRSDRLRRGYESRRSTGDRRLTAGLLALGVLSLGGAIALPTAQRVLFPLAGVGLFGGVLAYGLSAGRFIDASDGERVYGAFADNLAAVTDTLGLTDERTYVPVPNSTGVEVRLLLSGRVDHLLSGEGDAPIVDPDGRGLLLEPSGGDLYDEFREALTEPVATSPEPIAEQLIDALCHRFEFVTDADWVVSGDGQRVEITVSDSAFGPIDRFDHPVPSFLGVGFAAALDSEVSLEVSVEAERNAGVVVCRWHVGEASQSTGERVPS
ncbi:hypothetical protein [Natrinema marinum]|uniref:hypothetical protein n=1 Tax=Natrinema marinum TaxID=2961598 RepID=UPI0020C84A07|nr:hypothetical protein [Natrinema marinum]